ncbi:MAG: condensation domain-containing protein, partial [Actinobacteria bacterium]|nr:condensation domain-containing protein [Actinomycetota bacterium]
MARGDAGKTSGLADRKRELLRRRLAGERLTTGSHDVVLGAPREPGKGYPISPGQQRMWFLQQLNPSSVAYNIAAAFTLRGPLDEEVLRESLVGVVRRHEILRTTYRSDETGIPIQFIHPDLTVPWSTHDLSDVPQPEQDERIDRIAVDEARHVFDLAAEGPLRVALVRSSSDLRTLVLVAHHIAWDDESWEVFFGDLLDSYAAISRGVCRTDTERLPQYLDFAVQNTESAAEELAFWRQRLTPPPEPVELPGAHGRPVAGDEVGGQRSRVFAPVLLARVRELAAQAAASPFMVLLAAFNGLIHRCTGAADIVVGSPVVNRDGAYADRALGYFGNMVCLRTDPCSSDTFLGLIEKARIVCSGAFSHQKLDFERVVSELNPHRLDGVSTLFNVMFTVRRSVAAALHTEEVTATRRPLHNGSAQFPLSVTVEISDWEITVEVTYLSSVFSADSIDQILMRFEHFASAAVQDSEREIGRLDLLSGDERRRLLVEWNDTETDVTD